MHDESVQITAGHTDPAVLTPAALGFVARLHRNFEGSRRALLAERRERQARLDAGERPDFPAATRAVREARWKVAPVPKDLIDRRVEITGPPDRKMMINALNSGARVFMVDFEDSLSPTWANVVGGQRNLQDAVRGTIAYEAPDGRRYALGEDVATLMVRPRGWHLVEKHVLVDGAPVSASLFDFGLAFFHNARELLDQGSGPYFYLPKLEGRLEARLWNDVFCAAQEELGLAPGTIKATVLLETVLAAFEMDEILYELREHSAGLNAGRWDYIFSVIKKFRSQPDFVLPERSQVTMTVPFMRAYTELIVATCHQRGAHAMGGMAAFVPNRRDAAVTAAALSKVRQDKLRDSVDGFDAALGDNPNQLSVLRDDVAVTAADLLWTHCTGAGVSLQGVRTNVNVGIQYLESWLRGVGAAAIHNLMEDAATAEICRAQLWQWLRHGVELDDGELVTRQLLIDVVDDELRVLRSELGAERFDGGCFAEARRLFKQVALDDTFADFLTIPAYECMD
jgi:malate synthase